MEDLLSRFLHYCLLYLAIHNNKNKEKYIAKFPIVSELCNDNTNIISGFDEKYLSDYLTG